MYQGTLMNWRRSRAVRTGTMRKGPVGTIGVRDCGALGSGAASTRLSAGLGCMRPSSAVQVRATVKQGPNPVKLWNLHRQDAKGAKCGFVTALLGDLGVLAVSFR